MTRPRRNTLICLFAVLTLLCTSAWAQEEGGPTGQEVARIVEAYKSWAGEVYERQLGAEREAGREIDAWGQKVTAPLVPVLRDAGFDLEAARRSLELWSDTHARMVRDLRGEALLDRLRELEEDAPRIPGFEEVLLRADQLFQAARYEAEARRAELLERLPPSAKPPREEEPPRPPEPEPQDIRLTLGAPFPYAWARGDQASVAQVTGGLGIHSWTAIAGLNHLNWAELGHTVKVASGVRALHVTARLDLDRYSASMWSFIGPAWASIRAHVTVFDGSRQVARKEEFIGGASGVAAGGAEDKGGNRRLVLRASVPNPTPGRVYMIAAGFRTSVYAVGISGSSATVGGRVGSFEVLQER